MAASVLIVAEDEDIQRQASSALASQGIGPIASLRDGRLVGPYLDENPCDFMLLDVGDAQHSGPRRIGDLMSEHPHLAIVALGGIDRAATAVSCIHSGAYDYLVKPLDEERIIRVTRRALGLQRMRSAPGSPFSGAGDPFSGIITTDPAMLRIFGYLRSIAGTGRAVLITGETGTGKDLFARAIHQLSGRRGDYVPVNLAGMDDTMVSDCLFGHRKGAFSGAIDLRPGLVLRASSGSLFLDEIGDLSPVSQVKLLRLLQDGEYYPLGCDQPKSSTARIIAATSADLAQLQTAGTFRKDLFYRLRTHVIEVPPLRARHADIPLLLRQFAVQAASDLGLPMPTIGDAVVDAAMHHDFPGNVRELQSLVYDLVSRTPEGGALDPDALRLACQKTGARATAAGGVIFPEQLPSLKEVQELLVTEALRREAGNQAAAAALLGVTRQALNKRCRGSARKPI